MELDDFEKRWLAQDRMIDEIVQINQGLQRTATWAGPYAGMQRFRRAAMVEIVLGLLCLSWTGEFIYAHAGAVRFLAPAVALHGWLAGAVGVAVARLIRAGHIDYGAPVVTIQRQVEALRLFTLRALRILFVSGCAVWIAPLAIVGCRAILDVDLYATFGTLRLGLIEIGSVALGFAVVKLCALCADRWGSSSWLRQAARSLSGDSLNAAADQLNSIQAFERES